MIRNRSFAFVWAASIFSNLALGIATITETWYVVGTLGTKEGLGLVMMAASVPRFVLMAVGGVVADRMKRTHIVVATLLARVVLLLALALLIKLGLVGIGLMTLFAFLYGAVDAFFWPARDALLPGIVTSADLPRANSIMLTTNQIGLVFGPVVGASLIALMPYPPLLSITAALLGIGALLMSFVSESAAALREDASHLVAELREGLSYAFRTPVLRSLMLIYGSANLLFMGPNVVGVPLIVTENMHGNATHLSFLQGAFAAGMVAGGLALSVRPPTRKRLLVITTVISIEGVLLAFLGQVSWIHLGVAIEFLIGIGVICNNVPMMSLIQQYADRDKVGRIMSLNTVASMGLSPVSYAIVTALLSFGVDVRVILPAFGLTMSVVMILLSLRIPTIRMVD